MSTLRYQWNATCQDGCDWGSCPGHKYEVSYQSTSNYLSMYMDDKNLFCLSGDEANVLYEILEKLQNCRVEIRPDKKTEIKFL